MPRHLPPAHSFTGSDGLRGSTPVRPQASGAESITLTDLTSPEALEFFRRGGLATSSGATVTVESAMRVAVAWRCTHILAGACGNLPIDVYQARGGQRAVAQAHPLRQVLQRPNGWQTSAEFRKMMTAHAVLRGDAFALKLYTGSRLIGLWPLSNPDRVDVRQDPASMELRYTWTRPDGSKVAIPARDILHLRGLTLDGVRGIGVIKHARQALGLSLRAEEAAARTFSQGVIAGLVFSKPGTLSQEAFDRLRDELSQHEGAEGARKALILEDDLKVDSSLMTAEDLQFLQTRQFTRSDVGMFFGIPPHMYGDTEKSTSWGAGIEAQRDGFVTFVAEDWFVMWEQALERDCLTPADIAAGHYVRISRQALLRGDIKTRADLYTKALQWGWMSPDEVRALEDMNPRPDGEGGQFYDPPNTAGGGSGPDPTTQDHPQ